MNKKIIAAGLVLSMGVMQAAAAERERDRWDLSRIFADTAAWEGAFARVESGLDDLAGCRKDLGRDAKTFGQCLDRYYELSKAMHRVTAYASMRFDENTKVPASLEMNQKASLLSTRFAESTSFLEPGILAVGRQRIDRFLQAEPGLSIYRHVLDDVLRRAAHTRSSSEEEIIASAGLLSTVPNDVYDILANADTPWPTVTLSDGTDARLDQAGYTRYRALLNRADRKKVFDRFWSTWRDYARTFGVTLFSQIKRDEFYAKVRRYPNALAAALDGDRIPEAVYRTLVAETNANLPTLHRYFRLRARMLGLKSLRYYDIYPPLVKADVKFSIDQAERLVLEASRPLGDDYVATVRRGFDARWMDVYPRPGKKSGAYSNGSVYDVHPYVLMNYNEDYESVSTLAHEWGHAVHSYLANSAQPYATADYSTFLAEIASTFNEALLLEKMLKEARNDQERLFYLGSALEQLRGTFYRQTMFAEFELRIHELVEAGEALTGERFSQIYGDILRRYHGHDQGVLAIDDLYTVEWAYIPHFYYNFYVYQYATSIAASSLLADRVLAGAPGAVENYLALLKAGGSDYPYELLQRAGVDLASPAPYRSLFRRMNRIMDEIEAILARG